MKDNVGSLSSPVFGAQNGERREFKEISRRGQGDFSIPEIPDLTKLLTIILVSSVVAIGATIPQKVKADGSDIYVSPHASNALNGKLTSLQGQRDGVEGEIKANNARQFVIRELAELNEKQIGICLQWQGEGKLTLTYKYTAECAKLGVK